MFYTLEELKKMSKKQLISTILVSNCFLYYFMKKEVFKNKNEKQQ